MKRILLQITLCLFSGGVLNCQAKHSNNTLYPKYNKLIMAGYQGWFHPRADGTFFTDGQPVKIDMWPDMREYTKTYGTGFKDKNGKTARFFSSSDESTVDLHFKWMAEYGLDGVFVQRFFNNTRKISGTSRSATVLKHAINAASKYKRAIAVMYDLSGLKAEGEECTTIINDWKFLVDSFRITNPAGMNTYLYHNNKPVVAIWGVGFPDRPYDIKKIGLEEVIDFFKNDPVYGGCTVMIGVPAYWRDLNSDCVQDPYLHEIIKKTDLVLPWMVQRFTPLLHEEMERYRHHIKKDLSWCRTYGIEYVPCVYPGFSWHNLSKTEFPDDIKPPGSIPRMGGKFYWQQMFHSIAEGATMIYVAMFDEVNEGTAIFKVTDSPPGNSKVQFINLEGYPSDHYLWLTGEASKMLRGEIPLSAKVPQR